MDNNYNNLPDYIEYNLNGKLCRYYKPHYDWLDNNSIPKVEIKRSNVLIALMNKLDKLS